MAYFLILPVFVLWLIVAGASVVAAKKIPCLHPAYFLVWRISLWGTLGFVAANALLIAVLALGSLALGNDQATPISGHNVFQLLWGLTAIGGPVIASVLGWLIGVAVGALLAVLRHARLRPTVSSFPSTPGA